MKLSLTYRLITCLLGIALLSGVVLPSGLHAFTGQMCDVMEMDHADHQMPEAMMDTHADCPMEGQYQSDMADSSAIHSHMEMHDFGFACACSIDKAPVSTESQVLKKAKTPVIPLTGEVEAYCPFTETESDCKSTILSDSYAYSQPPIFLANESFLN